MSNFNAGHLRAIIALIFVTTINIGFFFTTKISPDLYASFAAAAMTYYFTGKNTSTGDASNPDSSALSVTTKVVQNPDDE